MENEQIIQLIHELQEKGYGDTKIANEIGWNKEKIRYFRSKHNIEPLKNVCVICKKPIIESKNTKFCSQECKDYNVIAIAAKEDAEVLKQWKN